MSNLLEQILVYGSIFLVSGLIFYYYLRTIKRNSESTQNKIDTARLEGRFEPISLHPHIDLSSCIGSGACISDCPEKDILGIVNGKASVINASNCVGHGACFHACPVEAISLRIGTESRGVELPHVNHNYETNVKGIYIAGELGGMGLIKNSVEQGQMAVQNIAKKNNNSSKDILDLIIIGAGPAGISAALTAKKEGLSSITLEQDTLGGTVFSFPRAKIVMTNPMDLPLYGKVKLFDTSKDELLSLWNKVISKNEINIIENTKVDRIIPTEKGHFKLVTNNNQSYESNNVLIAIGRRGTPRKLNIPGEELEKVSYRLIESERLVDKKIIVVGGGDSAIESAMLLMDNNEVLLSYRKDNFSRIKAKNSEKIKEAIANEKLNMKFSSTVVEINKTHIKLQETTPKGTVVNSYENDLVYIFIGGELPTKFLQNAGIEITKRFGHIVKTH